MLNVYSTFVDFNLIGIVIVMNVNNLYCGTNCEKKCKIDNCF